MSGFRAALLVGLLFPGVPVIAKAQDAPIALQVGANSYSMPVPQAYCLPEGEMIPAAEAMGRADFANFTLAHLYGCDEVRFYTDRWILVKTARDLVDLPLTDRNQWFTDWDTHYISQEDQVPDADLIERSEDSLGEQLDARPDIQIESRYLGRRDAGLCRAGQATVTFRGDVSHIRNVSCLTIIGERGFSVHVYSSRPETSDSELLALAEDVIASIRPNPSS